jgi:hypothetical protein
MPNLPRVGDLEIEHDMDFQRREWKIQRAGWAFMVLVIIAALLGLLGHGPLSRTSASDPDGVLTVEYERFVHYHKPLTLRFHISGTATNKDDLRLWVDRSYLDALDIHSITPEPERVEAGVDRHLFVFRVLDRDRPTGIVFHGEMDRVGSVQGAAGVADREPARFRQFVYP